MKLCTSCGETKPLSEFSKDKTRKDGHQSFCKECRKKSSHEWFVKNKEYKATYDKARDKELVSAIRKKSYSKHKENILKAKKEWYDNNKEHVAEQKKKWRTDNKATVNASNAKRRAMRSQATPAWADLEKIKAMYNVAQYFDWISGGFVKHHVDHIVPLRGKNVCGLHVENNLQILIDKDNLRKSNKHECKI
jgi:hypothetical protein